MKRIAFLMGSACTGKLTGELARREKILRSLVSPGTRIDIFGLEKDPAKSHLGTIQSAYDGALATPEDLECAIAAEQAGYQAVIIPCGGDPGVAPLREVVHVPVIPPGAAARHACSILAPRFSILKSGRGNPTRTEIHERDGLLKMISVQPINITVPEIRAKPKEAFRAMVREGRRAVKEYGAGAVTYSCMSMGFLMVDEELAAAIGVPAVNPVKAAVKMAEMFIDLGLTHSKLSYPIPPSRK